MAERERTSLRPEREANGGRSHNGERNLPVPFDADLRRHLPGVEPDRQLDDWGRSERVEGAMDKLLYDFMYRYWFRVEVEGIENIPASGGAMLVSNHSGALPPDAPMIAKAIKEEHPHPRPLHITIEHFFKGYPGFSMLVSKIGAASSAPTTHTGTIGALARIAASTKPPRPKRRRR